VSEPITKEELLETLEVKNQYQNKYSLLREGGDCFSNILPMTTFIV
jgi:hypothetical protein